jgi:hypothetical protein
VITFGRAAKETVKILMKNEKTPLMSDMANITMGVYP